MSRQRVKLLLISQPGWGGVRRHLCDLLRGLDADQFDITLMAGREQLDEVFVQTLEELSEKVHFVDIPELVRQISPKNDFRAYRKISCWIKENRPDIVHCHSSKAGVVGRLAAWRNHVPKIFYTAHWYAFLSPLFSTVQRSCYVFFERLMAHATTKTFNNSAGERQAALDRHIDKPDKLIVIYNGIADVTVPSKAELRAKLGLPPDSFVFGTIARMTGQKDPLLFMRMAAVLIELGCDFHFVWIGDGPLTAQVCDYIESNGLGDRVHLFPYREDADLVVGAFDAFLSTSVGEGFAYSPLEALRGGVPLFVSAVTGNIEVVQPGVNGSLFNRQTICDDPVQMLDFVDWAKDVSRAVIRESFLSRFSLDTMIGDITAEYLNGTICDRKLSGDRGDRQ